MGRLLLFRSSAEPEKRYRKQGCQGYARACTDSGASVVLVLRFSDPPVPLTRARQHHQQHRIRDSGIRSLDTPVQGRVMGRCGFIAKQGVAVHDLQRHHVVRHRLHSQQARMALDTRTARLAPNTAEDQLNLVGNPAARYKLVPHVALPLPCPVWPSAGRQPKLVTQYFDFLVACGRQLCSLVSLLSAPSTGESLVAHEELCAIVNVHRVSVWASQQTLQVICARCSYGK